jgi:hypothetical protein
MVNRRVDDGFCIREPTMLKIKLPQPNWSNWPTWATYGVIFMGGFLSGGISATNPPAFMSGYMPTRPQQVITVRPVETKTVSVDTRAAVACTASLAELQNFRKEMSDVCRKAQAAKASVAK